MLILYTPPLYQADNAAFRCKNKIGAAQYIGVTYDLSDGFSPTIGYTMDGYKGKLVKHWCREMQQYKQFDVPDGMHVQKGNER